MCKYVQLGIFDKAIKKNIKTEIIFHLCTLVLSLFKIVSKQFEHFININVVCIGIKVFCKSLK